MTERQMEDLISQFPDEFFRGHGLVLRGRQQSLAEVGRFDLLFVDSYQTNILTELKARVAKYEDASQMANGVIGDNALVNLSFIAPENFCAHSVAVEGETYA
jgi:hypothetical protein